MRQILLNIIIILILTGCKNDFKTQLDLINQKVDNEEYKEALVLISQLDINKDNSDYKRVLVRKQFCENELGLYQEAIKTLEEIVKVSGDKGEQYLRQIAVMNYKIGDLEKAFSTMDQIRKSGYKFDFTDYYNLGQFEFGRANYARAIVYFDSSRVAGDYRDIFYRKAICEIELGLFESALNNLNEFEKLIDQDHDEYVDLLIRRAYVYSKLNKITEANKDLETYMRGLRKWDKEEINFFEVAAIK